MINTFDIAMRQSAEDVGCRPDDFLRDENTVLIFSPSDDAKVYLRKPQDFLLIKYGRGAVVAVCEKIYDRVRGHFSGNGNSDLSSLSELGLTPSFTTMCFLPSDHMTALPCRYKTRVLGPDRFNELYLPEWENALCKKRRELDMLAVGAYDGDRLVGLAGASADCAEMWQIGIDVLPEYRRQGIASALTSQLAVEIKDRGKLPFYSAEFYNIASMKNAHKSGFIPAWIQIQADLG